MAGEQKTPAVTAGGAVRASAAKPPEAKAAAESDSVTAPPDPSAEIERGRAELAEARRNFQAERELAEEDLRAQREHLANQRGQLEQELAKAAESVPSRVVVPGRVGVGQQHARADFDHRFYVVAPGHSLSTARGILGPGEAVTLADFGGNAEALAIHIAKGRVVYS